MGQENSQKWFERNRPPRVQISYDVETAGAVEKKELPLVVGVIADLSGMRDATVIPSTLGERRFIEIDRDTFDQVLTQIGPRIDVGGLGLGATGTPMAGVIRFDSIDDFEPERVVNKVDGLRELFRSRNQLRDLMAKLDGNAALETQLQDLFLSENGTALSREERNARLDAVFNQSPAATPASPATGNGAGQGAATQPPEPTVPPTPNE